MRCERFYAAIVRLYKYVMSQGKDEEAEEEEDE